MKLSAIKFLDPIQIEAISRKCNIDEGLIVQDVQVLILWNMSLCCNVFLQVHIIKVIYCQSEPQVSDGSSAERQGIRTGDILQCWNGVYISTTVEVGEVTIYYVPFK